MLHTPFLMGAGSKVEPESWTFTVSVSDDTGYQTGVPINLYGQDGIKVYIDWGDGEVSTLTSDDYPDLTDSGASIHQYEAEGEYTVTVSSTKWNKLYLESVPSTSTGTNNSYYAMYYWRSTLTAVTSAFPTFAGTRHRGSWTYTNSSSFNGIYYLFYDCELLADIPNDLFNNNAQFTVIRSAFRDCVSLTAIPTGLFDNLPLVTTFEGCFWGCSSLLAIPTGLFDNNLAATDFDSCFYQCTSITEIPTGLFDNNVAVTNFRYCFYGWTSLTEIPDGLFDNCPLVTDFMGCFRGCTSITTIPDGLFDNNTAATSFKYCFQSCTGLTSVPEDLFIYNTAVTDFTNCFYYSFLFDGSIHIGSEIVTSADAFMDDASDYDRYVYVPAGSTTADTFNALSITGLTVVEE